MGKYNKMFSKIYNDYLLYFFYFFLIAIVICSFIVAEKYVFNNFYSYNGYQITIHRDKKTINYESISKIIITKDKDLFIIKYEEEKGKFKEAILNNKDINFEITEKEIVLFEFREK